MRGRMCFSSPEDVRRLSIGMMGCLFFLVLLFALLMSDFSWNTHRRLVHKRELWMSCRP